MPHKNPEQPVKLDLTGLFRFEKRIKDMRPLMRKISQIMLDAVEENFEQQGRPRWKPLKESTIERRKKQGLWPGKILQARGHLAASVQGEYSKNRAIVLTNKIYAAIHQFGGLAGRGLKAEIPARPFLALRNDDIREIEKKISQYFH